MKKPDYLALLEHITDLLIEIKRLMINKKEVEDGTI